MSDLDEPLHRDLVALAERMPTSDLADSAVHYGRRIRRGRRATFGVVAVVVAVAAIVIPLTLAAGSSGAPPSKLADTSPTVSPRPEGTTAAELPFEVAGPPVTIIGGSVTQRRLCAADEIHATATLRPAPDGVVGVVNLTTRHNCATQLDAIHPTLVDAAGLPLEVRVVANADHNNPAIDEGWIPFTSFGFAWDGSWCGTHAAAVTIALNNGSVRAPLAGPQPGCTGMSNSVLIPGALGYVGDPVQGAPPEWRYLTATLRVAPVTPGPALHNLQLTLTNSSGQPVVLQPRPTYVIGVRDKYGDGTQGEADHPLPLRPGALVVPAHGTLRIALPVESILPDYPNLRGGQVSVTFAMAGVASASATTRVMN
jgi:hypothetical protein